MRRLWLMQLISNYSFRPRFFLYCTFVNRLIYWIGSNNRQISIHAISFSRCCSLKKFPKIYLLFVTHNILWINSGSVFKIKYNFTSKLILRCCNFVSMAIITIAKNLKTERKLNWRESTKICPITTWGRQNTLKFCNTYRCYTRKSQEKADDSHPYTHVTLVFTGRGKFVLNARQKRL